MTLLGRRSQVGGRKEDCRSLEVCMRKEGGRKEEGRRKEDGGGEGSNHDKI
jgi:hypothetical protein